MGWEVGRSGVVCPLNALRRVSLCVGPVPRALFGTGHRRRALSGASRAAPLPSVSVSHCLIHRCARVTDTLSCSAPHCASQSAISFPGTCTCERTWHSVTSSGRSFCSARHAARRRVIIGAFRHPLLRGLGSHFPVAMWIAYVESAAIHSRPAPRGRVRAGVVVRNRSRDTWQSGR